MKMKRICILEEMPIMDLSLVQAQAILGKRSRNRVVTVLMADMAQCMRCAKSDTDLTCALTADVILAQGEEVRVAAAMLGTSLTSEAFGAADLIISLMKKEKGRFFFLGGDRGYARRSAVLAAKKAECVPCPAVGGAPGNFKRHGKENTAVLTRIWECQPNIVVVGLDNGMTWLCDNREKLPPALYICVPESVIFEMAEDKSVQLRDRTPLDAWHYYRMRAAFYYRVRRKMNKAE